MFELSVQGSFSAAHAIAIKGQREPLHGHDWRVVATIRGPVLDSDGLLCDFHELERGLATVIRPLQNTNLNVTPPFDDVNPTAEHVAKHIAEHLTRLLPAGVESIAVAVTEAPGCTATYRIGRGT
jgi:6-pyruvoyltetrahydropterin/6-carboxytetrahydropterin synthase